MNVLSLFDGISAGRLALKRAGLPVEKYFAYEIDKYAIKISENNFSDVIHLGDINNWEFFDSLPDIQLILAGFPCQAYSNAGKRLGLDDLRGQLIYPMLKIIEKYKPKNLLLENVKGFLSPKHRPVYDFLMNSLKDMGYDIEMKVANSSLVSAQNRERVYWTNWKWELPEDKENYLADILEEGEVDRKKSYCIDANYYKGGNPKSYFDKGRRQLVFKGAAIRNQVTKNGVERQLNIRKDDKSNCVVPSYPNRLNGCIQIGVATQINGHDILKRVYSSNGKSPTVTAHSGGNMEPKVALDEKYYRKLTPLECERLQTFPDNFTATGKRVLQIVEFFGKLKKWKTLVNLPNVKEKAIPNLAYASCTIKDSNDMELLNYHKGQLENVIIVIEFKLPKECVINIIKIGLDMETPYLQIPLGKQIYSNPINLDTLKNEAKDIELFIGMLWNKSLAEKFAQKILFIILTLIKQIMPQEISTYAQNQPTKLFISNLKKLLLPSLSGELSYLEMENTEKIHNTQRYKTIGNSWTVDMITHILKGLK